MPTGNISSKGRSPWPQPSAAPRSPLPLDAGTGCGAAADGSDEDSVFVSRGTTIVDSLPLSSILSGPHRGFTLVELMIAIALLAVVTAIAVPMFEESREAAKISQAIGDIRGIESEIDLFEMSTERLPSSLDEIGRGGLEDPWGNPYVYTNFALDNKSVRRDKNLKPINSSYDLYSSGKDGQSKDALTANVSRDDIVRASDGGFVGLADDY